MNHHVITWLRFNLQQANRLRQLTARSRLQVKLINELARQLG